MSNQDACVVLTRPFEDNRNLGVLLEQDGILVIENPLIEIVAIEVPKTRKTLERLRDYDAVIVTSGSVFRVLDTMGIQSEGDTSVCCYVVGQRTAQAARRFGWTAVYPDGVHRAADLFGYIESQGVPRKAERQAKGPIAHARGSLLWLKGQLADSQNAEALREAGFLVDEVSCYETKALPMQSGTLLRLLDTRCPVIPFYSPSAVGAFLASDAVRERHSEISRIACFAIGAATAQAILKGELFLAGTAKETNDVSVHEAVCAYLTRPTG